jgi:Family of unknown function (DUF5309)
MATTNLDSADLKAVAAGGLIRENVMEQIWQIDHITLPFTDRAGKTTTDNAYAEWTTRELADPDLNNAVVDGADLTGNHTQTGQRVGNQCQESVKIVRVSDRAAASDTIGGAGGLAEQLGERQKELKQDIEAISLTMQGSVADDGATVAGKTAGVFAWTKTNISAGATGTHTGFNTGTKLVAAGTAGTKRALTEKMLRDIAQMVFQEGGDERAALVAMGRPAIKRIIDEYSFTSSARIATQTTDVGDGPGMAVGYIDVFKSDFNALQLVANRLQPVTAAAASTLGLFNFDFIKLCYLKGIYVKELATTGLAENRAMAADWCTQVLNEKALGAIFDIDEALPMTAV